MQSLFSPKPDTGVRFKYVAPACAALAATALVVVGLLAWSSVQVDRVSFARQESLVSLVLKQSIGRVPHDQESSTVWDNAVAKVHEPIDAEWFDFNLGIWMHTYFGHDRAYVLTSDGQPIYAMIDGKRGAPSDFEGVANEVLPLVAALRGQLVSKAPPILDSTVLSAGEADLRVIDGHPAIVSAKPIVSDTGNVAQEPGSEFIHVAIRYLDGSFVADLAKNYRLDGARFSRVDDPQSDEASFRLATRQGETIGYFIWQPFLPGSAVLSDTVPVLAIALLAIGLIFVLLLARLRRSAVALQASEAQAQHLAFHDTLTGLPNRALFSDRLDHALADVRTDAGEIALLYLDLDRFKQVNDTLGHPAGDELIREVGRRLRRVLGERDMVARLGGDEFAVLQRDVRSSADVSALCARLQATIAEPFVLVGSQAFVGVSIGVALSPTDGIDRTELTRKADIALYSAKANGRGRTVIFREDMDETLQHRRAIERDLRYALRAGDQLFVVYQPLFSAQSGEVTGVEALVRWNHPTHGPMAPTTFIPVAEETGIIEPIGDFVLRAACLAGAAWPGKTISVNVSAVQLRNSSFARRVLNIVRRTGLEPSRLQLEITETALVESLETLRPTIATLRANGVRIALDDFGTGYSSLSHLRQFDVDRVKIDRSFVHGLDKAIGGEAIIRAIVDLARGTGLDITAEGVETREQSSYLTDIGCDELQGFLLARPATLAEIDTLLGVDRSSRQRPDMQRDAA